MAVLIDGDNAQPSLIDKMLAEVSKYGLAIIRRVYGDWTTSNMAGWKDSLQTYAIQPIQQFRFTIGKNATDSAMIIDAMDVLYTGPGWTGSAWSPVTATHTAWRRASVRRVSL